MITSSTAASTRPGTTPAQDLFLAASGDLETPFLVLDLDVVAERFTALQCGAARRDDLLRHEGEPGARGADVAGRPRLLLRRRQPRRDRPLPRGRHRSGAAVVREHDQEGAATSRPPRARRGAHVRRRLRRRARQGRPPRPGRDRVRPRLATDGAGADWPLSRKFGCGPGEAAKLALRATATSGWASGSRSTSARSSATRRRGRRRSPTPPRSSTGVVAAGGRPAGVNLGGGLPSTLRLGDARRRRLRRDDHRPRRASTSAASCRCRSSSNPVATSSATPA